tara:strand:- start:1938 stop:3269 length:1332 start_codon:yes stop_codon:yes gene_type:complete
MSYIGKTTDGFGVRDRFVYVVSGGATSVSGADANGATLKFTDGAYVDVYLNGVLLKAGTDYNTNTSNTIAGIASMSANDEVTVIVYDVFTVADTVSAASGGAFNGAVTANSTLDMNGTELILDADGDTSITADTDDRIDFKTGGSDRMKINSNGSVGIASDVTTSDLNIGAGVGSYATIQMTPGGTTTGNIIYFGDSGDADYSSITSFGSGAGETGRMRFIVGTQESLNINQYGTITQSGNNSGSLIYEMQNANGSNPYGCRINFTGVDVDNNTTYFLSGEASSNNKFKIFSDGDMANHDNSYGSLSDERIKQDITEANSQWDDIKAVKVRNFKKKDDIEKYGEKAWSQIGVIAQELETTSPKLIKETPPEPSDIKHSSEFGTLYEDGDTIPEGKKVGDVKEIKSNVKKVSYSILYMKAVKALQEAMTRIETLEAKVKALEEA